MSNPHYNKIRKMSIPDKNLRSKIQTTASTSLTTDESAQSTLFEMFIEEKLINNLEGFKLAVIKKIDEENS